MVSYSFISEQAPCARGFKITIYKPWPTRTHYDLRKVRFRNQFHTRAPFWYNFFFLHVNVIRDFLDLPINDTSASGFYITGVAIISVRTTKITFQLPKYRPTGHNIVLCQRRNIFNRLTQKLASARLPFILLPALRSILLLVCRQYSYHFYLLLI